MTPPSRSGRSARPDGAIPSPNIWHHTSTYEIENRAVDPDGRLWDAIVATAPFAGRDLLDLGCGAGFHLPLFAALARSVIGVEPHASLAALARRRTRRLGNVEVREGLAQQIPVPDASVDMVHVRWAYFFGPGAEPGLAELNRVVRRGGTAVVIDNDATRSTFGNWFRRGYPSVDPDTIEGWWSQHGWSRQSIDMGWRFESLSDLEAVIRIEFAPELADQILDEHRAAGSSLEVDYAVNLWSKEF